MKMRFLITVLAVAPLCAQAQIYRCDTPDGPVFSDEKCGEQARVVTLGDESQGLGGGPSEEVREYLDKKRQERAQERDTSAKLTPRQPAATVVQQAQPVENAALLPGYVRPGRPHVRPRPLPARPGQPDNNDNGGSPAVLKPRTDNRD
jgi:hypothetical protein